MPRRPIPRKIREQVRRRANHLCEYCHTSEQWQYVRFTIDHVVPVTRGGNDALVNLALACFHCNRRKADRLTAVDPDSNAEVPLFNPRQHPWKEHFIWTEDGIVIIGLTPIGRATIELLKLNRERILEIRFADVEVGRHPPPDDPVQSTG